MVMSYCNLISFDYKLKKVHKVDNCGDLLFEDWEVQSVFKTELKNLILEDSILVTVGVFKFLFSSSLCLSIIFSSVSFEFYTTT